jgi:hypothetical protein
MSTYENNLFFKDELSFYRTMASLEQARHSSQGKLSSVDFDGMVKTLEEKEVFNKATMGIYLDLFMAEHYGVDI